MSAVIDFYVPVVQCRECSGEGIGCNECGCTGSFYWADGRAFPYSPAGERQARQAQKLAAHGQQVTK